MAHRARNWTNTRTVARSPGTAKEVAGGASNREVAAGVDIRTARVAGAGTIDGVAGVVNGSGMAAAEVAVVAALVADARSTGGSSGRSSRFVRRAASGLKFIPRPRRWS